MKTTLYKRNAQGKPLSWAISREGNTLKITHGLVGKTLHTEYIDITLTKVDEYTSRINAKRKEGYKELSELKDSNITLDCNSFGSDFDRDLYKYLETYLPKYSTTSEGFVLPMLAKVLEDNKPFEKGNFLGQWKINGLRCIVGAEKNNGDMFNPIKLTYHSRTGEDWTAKMCWMDEILLPNIKKDLLDIMVEEGACLDGELYLPGYSVNDINSFVKNTKIPQHYLLQYWCYDICCENMLAKDRMYFIHNNIKIQPVEFEDKIAHLNNENKFVILPSVIVENITEAIKYRNDFIDKGFEGLIVRNFNAEYQFGKRNQAMFKFKKIDDGYFEVLDIKEDKRGLPIYVLKNDINDELFEATINLPQDKQRQQLQMKQFIIGKKALVEFRERSGVKQVPFHSKIIKIIV